MTWPIIVLLAMKVLGGTFCLLLFLGLLQGIKNKLALGPGARALALAGNRYVRAEIDAETFRRIRADLRS